MIYDRNQFTFNVVFVLILVAMIGLNVYYAGNFKGLQEKYLTINQTLAKIESNQNFNFLQGGHHNVYFQLTTEGMVLAADNFGEFSGPSMQPSIFDGHTLIEEDFAGGPLEEGTIVRFIRGNQAVIHRVRADYGDAVFVQGDSLKEGEVIDKDQITHIVIGVLFT